MAERILAEFATPDELAAALRALRRGGRRALDAHTPYSTEAVRDALEHKPSRLPWLIFLGGVAGAGGAYFLQWLLVAWLYPLDVGARPAHMPLAFVPITFEMGVLLASATAFFGVLGLGRLVKLWDPVFEADGFESSSVDAFWLSVADAGDQADSVVAELERLGARRVLRIEVRP